MSSLGAHNSGPDSDGPEVPEPSHAEKARTLVYLQQTGELSTLSRKQPGWPFGSVMPYGLDRAQPVFHQFHGDAHAEPARRSRAQVCWSPQRRNQRDPLGAAGVTLMGSVTKVPKGTKPHRCANDIWLVIKRTAYWVTTILTFSAWPSQNIILSAGSDRWDGLRRPTTWRRLSIP